MFTEHYLKNSHIKNLMSDPYYKNLVILRNIVEMACDDYFQKLHAPKIDLFLIAKGVSSPTGKGSDSLPIPLRLGQQSIFLVDSAQFGMEPLVAGRFDMVYCYLPSFRGEDADDCHLNQFYHCEAEMKGNYQRCMKIVESLVKRLIEKIINASENSIFNFKVNNFREIQTAVKKTFPVITFDEVEILLKKHKLSHLIEIRSYGRVLTHKGEIKITELVGNNQIPVWITKFDRDVVAFYQKPDPKNIERVLNSDLIFPSINGGFGGEIVGSGQRQDSAIEMLESMKRQEIKNLKSYKWYIDLRRNPKYESTSGFGLGVERFIAWMLGLRSIVDAAIYPIIKNEQISY